MVQDLIGRWEYKRHDPSIRNQVEYLENDVLIVQREIERRKLNPD